MAATYERKKLTKAFCDTATAGEQKQKLFLDTELPGFGLLVGQQAKTFIVQRSVPGHGFERCKVDRFGTITVDEARRRGREMLLAMGQGVSQVARRRPKPASTRGMTLREAWALHKGEMEKEKASAKTLRTYEGMLKLYFANWNVIPDPKKPDDPKKPPSALAEITRADVREWHKTIKADIAAGRHALEILHPKRHHKPKGAKVHPVNRTGEQTANACLRLLRAIWNTALREDDNKGQSGQVPPYPAHELREFKIDLSPVKRRAENLHANLRQWHTELQQANIATTLRDLQLFMLYSGMRATASMEVRWEHVDFARRKLFVPNPKGGTDSAFHLPLSDYLVQLLQRRQEEQPDSPWVFPSAGSKSGYIGEDRVKGKISVPYTPHDLRRVFSTVATELKVHPYHLMKLVNHSLGKGVTKGYVVKLDVEDLRGPMQAITDKLRAMCEEPEPAHDNVVPIATRKRVSA